MSQSIRVGSGLVPILQHVPNTSSSSSSCMFLSTEHTTEVGFPTINLSSVKECRKRAASISVVSNRNPRLPFLPCAATSKSSSNVNLVDEDGGSSSSSNKGKGGKYDDPLKVVLLGISQVWLTILSALRYMASKWHYNVSKGVVATMILIDLHDPIDVLKVLLDVSQTWRMILSLCDDLYDGKGFDDYSESYHRKARMMEGGKQHRNPPLKLAKSRLRTLRILVDLNDPFDGLKVLSEDLEFWRTVFSSELNDSEGYLQKEIFALRDLSLRARISVSNCNGKHDEGIHDEAKNPLSQITHVLELLKFRIHNFEDPSDVVEAIRQSFRTRDETSGPLVAADAKLNFDDNDGYL